MAERPTSGQSVRWWPALMIAGLGGAGLAWVWLAVEGHRQRNVMLSIQVGLLTVLLLLVWLLFLSRLRLRHRLLGLAAVFLVLVVAASLVTVRGVSGDLVPVLGWRFARAADELPVPVVTDPTGGGVLLPEVGRGYPQYLGPERDAVLAGPLLDRDWAASPPELLWRVPVGAAWSGFAIAGDAAVTQEQRGGLELVTCYDLRTGALRWSHEDAARHEDPLGGVGPRATPTVAGGRVYSHGGTGILNALDFETGRRIWSADVLADAGSAGPEYGISTSPLVLEEAVVVYGGGGAGALLVAYDRETGALLWRAGADPDAYSSPMLARLAGREQVLILGRDDLSAYDPATGEALWDHPWLKGAPRAAQPVLLPGDRVLISGGYGAGSQLLAVTSGADGFAVEVVWESRSLKAKFANVVHRDGVLYGLDDGILVAVDAGTGERLWKRGRYGHGQLILAGDTLVVQTEDGAVALVAAVPDVFEELATLAALDGKTWNNPALAGPYLVVRNDLEAACYKLPLRADSDG